MDKVIFFILFFSFGTMSFAADHPFEKGKIYPATVINEIALHGDALIAEPIEVVNASISDCVIFGLIYRQNEQPGGPLVADVKRLACKAGNTFRIWSIKGKIGVNGSIKYRRSAGGYSIIPDTKTDFRIDSFSSERESYQVYLYDKHRSHRPIKINLGQILYFQEGSGSHDDNLPDFLQEDYQGPPQ